MDKMQAAMQILTLAQEIDGLLANVSVPFHNKTGLGPQIGLTWDSDPRAKDATLINFNDKDFDKKVVEVVRELSGIIASQN